MSELADELTNEASHGGISSAEINSSNETLDSGNQDHSSTEKLTLRDQINKSVESVRKEEATRARDSATGKFAKIEAGAPEKAAAAEIPKTEQNAQPTESKPVGPPSGWSKEAQALWDQLPPAVKADAVRREAEVAKGFDEYRGKTAQLVEISQVLEPLKPILQQNGIQTEAQAVKRLLEWEGSFRNPATRVQSFHNLARQYGIDIHSLVQNSSPQPSSAQEIPEPLRPVIDQFGNIVQDVNSVKQELQKLRSDRVENELSAFSKDNPYFERVRSHMGRLMSPVTDSNGNIIIPAAAATLEEAYQQAIWGNPEIRKEMLAAEEAKRQAELTKTNAEKVARARAASISPSPRSPNGAPVNGQVKSKANSVRASLLSSIGELREGQRA